VLPQAKGMPQVANLQSRLVSMFTLACTNDKYAGSGMIDAHTAARLLQVVVPIRIVAPECRLVVNIAVTQTRPAATIQVRTLSERCGVISIVQPGQSRILAVFRRTLHSIPESMAVSEARTPSHTCPQSHSSTVAVTLTACSTHPS
jgi:low temperature requirement protein LtrA